MFKFFFELSEKLARKVYSPRNSFFWRIIKRCYHEIKIIANPAIMKPNENAIAFFIQNTERVNAVANMLADEQSRNEYLGMVKFRQTHCKKDFPKLKYEPEYFLSNLKFSKDEVFIDCGAFIGDTVDDFLKHCSEYKQIVAFEPDVKVFEVLNKKYGNNQKITLINSAVYNKEGEIAFKELDAGYSRIIDEQGGGQNDFTCIQVKTIDNLNLEKVSFIKMDIEGAELNALKGAQKTILRDKPKLAICIYHSDEDMLCIAEYIHNLVPEYNLYIRHHCFYPHCSETVLYAQF
ncbi:MAG: FkbM family methyltransferase [Fibromonadaceae bacterium]|jgi:FkbM family methyltransferase|nr:FkbM family methyltransferase [Fibromonadaceae bacterium]